MPIAVVVRCRGPNENYFKLLTSSVETLFLLCDETDHAVRSAVEENLNKLVKVRPLLSPRENVRSLVFHRHAEFQRESIDSNPSGTAPRDQTESERRPASSERYRSFRRSPSFRSRVDVQERCGVSPNSFK